MDAAPTSPARGPQSGSPRPPNRLSPLRFVLSFGVVSMLADFVYEGGRSIVGPFLATLGASAVAVGVITGVGEAVAAVFRLVSGPMADRTRRHWALAIAGYLITAVAVPFTAAAGNLSQAAAAVIGERFGKAVRTPARDTMLAEAAVDLGRGRAFAYHEALDQSGALFGPLVVAAMVALSGYRLGFAVLAFPGALAGLALWFLRRAVPDPASYSEGRRATRAVLPEAGLPGGRLARLSSHFGGFSARYWRYSAFTATSVAGFATFGVISYHLEVRHVLAAPLIPVLYAVAMGTDALAALGSGRLYDRFGLAGLAGLPALTVAIPFLSFSDRPVLVWAGAVVWGAALGVHESTMRAAVADLVPAARRGTGYGVFTALYGVTWLAGSTVIGVLYAVSVGAIEWFVGGLQVVALVLVVPLALGRQPLS